MKVTVDLDEIEALKEQIKNLEIHNGELYDSLKKLDKEALINDAEQKAVYVFQQLISKLCENNGFKYQKYYVEVSSLRNILGCSWYEMPQLKIDILPEVNQWFGGIVEKFNISSDNKEELQQGDRLINIKTGEVYTFMSWHDKEMNYFKCEELRKNSLHNFDISHYKLIKP